MTDRPLLAIVRDLAPGFATRDAADPERYPAENIADLQRAGVLVAPFPPSLGGQSAPLDELALVVERVAAASPSTALLLAMPLGLASIYGVGPEGAPEPHRAAWAAQIEQVAAEYRAGKIYAACNSEKGAGGSLAATKTVAARGADGGFALTGEKILASFGRHADYFFATARVQPEELPGAGIVEFFVLRTDAAGVEIRSDWDGFGMRSTESHSVGLSSARVEHLLGFPNFIETVQPASGFSCLFAAIPLGCAGAILTELATPTPASPALRLRFSEALMRYEALRAYLTETAAAWRPGGSPASLARALRTKTHVTEESAKLCAELFALSGGRHYTASGRLARTLAASFAGTALRPPLPLALDTLTDQFDFGHTEEGV